MEGPGRERGRSIKAAAVKGFLACPSKIQPQLTPATMKIATTKRPDELETSLRILIDIRRHLCVCLLKSFTFKISTNPDVFLSRDWNLRFEVIHLQ